MQNGIFIDITDFPVGDRHFDIDIFFFLKFPQLFQITCEKQKVPEIILRGLHIFIGDVFVNRFRNGTAFNERFNLPADGKIRFFHKNADNVIGAGIGPVGPGQSVSVSAAGGYEVYDAPGVINLCIAETVSVVPLFYRFRAVRQIINSKHLIHILLRKAEILRAGIIGDGQDPEIVQSGKNGFSADPQAAGNHRKSQIVICLEGGLKQGADRKENVVIESMKPGVFQRDIIFIDQDHGLFSETGMQTFREVFKGVCIVRIGSIQIPEPDIAFQCGSCQLPTVMHGLPVAGKFCADRFFEHGKRKLQGGLFHGFQREADHRISSHMGQILFSGFQDFRAGKENGRIFPAFFKKTAEHAHV